MSLQPEHPLRTVLRRGSNHVTLSKGMDFYESQLRSRSINIAAEATEDNQDAHSQEPSEIQTTHQDSISCFQSGNFMLARGASNTKKVSIAFYCSMPRKSPKQQNSIPNPTAFDPSYDDHEQENFFVLLDQTP